MHRTHLKTRWNDVELDCPVIQVASISCDHWCCQESLISAEIDHDSVNFTKKIKQAWKFMLRTIPTKQFPENTKAFWQKL